MSRKESPLAMEYIILGLIQRNPVHAYDMFKILSDPDISTIWYFNQSQVYAMLEKMEKNGLITPEICQGSAFPFRKVYSLTKKGSDLFQSWKTTPITKINKIRSEFLAKLYFLVDDPIETYQSVLDDQIEACRKIINENTDKLHEADEGSPFLKMVYTYREENAQSVINWLTACKKERSN